MLRENNHTIQNSVENYKLSLTKLIDSTGVGSIPDKIALYIEV